MRFLPKKMRLLVLAFAVGAAACLALVATHATGAYFSDTKSGAFSGTLGTWGPYLHFTPGCAKAAHPCGCGWPDVPIASLDTQGNLSLDFGSAYPESCYLWLDVFRITSSAFGPLQVSFTTSGPMAAFVSNVQFGLVNQKKHRTTARTLTALQTRRVRVRLCIPAGTVAGTYSGTLVVAVVGSSESYSIPMVIRVLLPNHEPSPPVTTCDYDGLWHKSPVTVHFSATDTGHSGIAYTEYSLDNGSGWTKGTSVTVSSAGTNTVLYRSTNNDGDVETAKSVSVKIDLTAPTTTAGVCPSGWTRCSVTLTLAATDSGGSGLKATYYRIDGQSQQTYAAPVTLSDATPVTYWSIDKAGNVEQTHTFTPQIDTTAPITAATASPSGWTNGSVTLTLAATDSGGCGVEVTYYKIDCQSQQTYSTPITLTSSAPVTYWSLDSPTGLDMPATSSRRTPLRHRSTPRADDHGLRLSQQLDQRLGHPHADGHRRQRLRRQGDLLQDRLHAASRPTRGPSRSPAHHGDLLVGRQRSATPSRHTASRRRSTPRHRRPPSRAPTPTGTSGRQGDAHCATDSAAPASRRPTTRSTARSPPIRRPSALQPGLTHRHLLVGR